MNRLSIFGTLVPDSGREGLHHLGKDSDMDRRTFLTITLAAPVLGQVKKPVTESRLAGVAWTQWGGPNRNFQTEARGIRDTWPASGPRVIWKRPLGEGYSSPVVENGLLYTMYGKRGEEVVLAANAETGETLWEQPGSMTFQSDAAQDMGNGPYSTPLIVGDRLFTTGVAGRLQCLMSGRQTCNPGSFSECCRRSPDQECKGFVRQGSCSVNY